MSEPISKYRITYTDDSGSAFEVVVKARNLQSTLASMECSGWEVISVSEDAPRKPLAGRAGGELLQRDS